VPQTPSTIVDTDQIAAFHEIVYAGYDWPEGALIGVCSAPGQGRGFRLDAQIEPTDLAHFVQVCSAAADAGRHVWSGVALSQRVSSGRGKAADVLAGAALVLDLDCRPDDAGVVESGHKAQALPHPTRSQVEGWVAASPWADELLLTETGGGLQGWLLLTAPLPAAELAVLQERWARMWEASADRHGWAFDAGVSRDLARVLRVPGTRNRKPAYGSTGAPVTLLRPGSRVELAAVDGPWRCHW